MAGSFYGLRAQQVGYAPLDISGYLNTALKGFDQAGNGLADFGKSIQNRDDARFLTGLMQQKDYNTMKNWLANGAGAQLGSYASLETAKAAADHLQNQIITDTSADKLALEQEKDKFANYFTALKAKELLGDVAGVNAVQKAFANGAYGASDMLGRLVKDADPNSEENKRAMAAESKVRAAKGRRELEDLEDLSKYGVVSEANANQRIADFYKMLNSGQKLSPEQFREMRAYQKIWGIKDPSKAVDTQAQLDVLNQQRQQAAIENSKAAQKQWDAWKQEQLDKEKTVANASNVLSKALQANQEIPEMNEPEDAYIMGGAYSNTATNSAVAEIAKAAAPISGFNVLAQRAGINKSLNDFNTAESIFNFRNNQLSDAAIAAMPKEKQQAALDLRKYLDEQNFIESASKVMVANRLDPQKVLQGNTKDLAYVTQDAQAKVAKDFSNMKRTVAKEGVPLSLIDSTVDPEVSNINSSGQAVAYNINKLPEKARSEQATILFKNQIDKVKKAVPDLTDAEAAVLVYEGLTNKGFFESNEIMEYLMGKRSINDNTKLAVDIDKVRDLATKLRSKKVQDLKDAYRNLQIYNSRINTIDVNPIMYNKSTNLIDRAYNTTSDIRTLMGFLLGMR